MGPDLRLSPVNLISPSNGRDETLPAARGLDVSGSTAKAQAFVVACCKLMLLLHRSLTT
jgi:hypothetical protein